MSFLQPYNDVPAIEFEGIFMADSVPTNMPLEELQQHYRSMDSGLGSRKSPGSHGVDSSAYLMSMQRHLLSLTNSANGYGYPSNIKIPEPESSRLAIHSSWSSGVEQYRNQRYVSPSGHWGGSLSATESAPSECAYSPDVARHRAHLFGDPYDAQDAYSSSSFEFSLSSGHGNWTPRDYYAHNSSQSSASSDQAVACNLKDLQYTPDTDEEADDDCIKVELHHPEDLAISSVKAGFTDEGLGRSVDDVESLVEEDEDRNQDSDFDPEYHPEHGDHKPSVNSKRPAVRSPRKTRSIHSTKGIIGSGSKVTKPSQRRSSMNNKAKPSPRGAKSQKRLFTCSFSHYGCGSTFGSKNEWKRHVGSQHLQLGFYRCDTGLCNPDNARSKSSTANPNHNDFNRKDLFTQHHRRMHTPWPPASRDPSMKIREEFERSLEEVRTRCWQERRTAPERSSCGFCQELFVGENSWEDRMEHVGKHFEKLHNVEDGLEEMEDEDLREWALAEGIIEDHGEGEGVWLVGMYPPAASGNKRHGSRERRGKTLNLKLDDEVDDESEDLDAEGDDE